MTLPQINSAKRITLQIHILSGFNVNEGKDFSAHFKDQDAVIKRESFRGARFRKAIASVVLYVHECML
jgi:hypothetical protein